MCVIAHPCRGYFVITHERNSTKFKIFYLIDNKLIEETQTELGSVIFPSTGVIIASKKNQVVYLTSNGVFEIFDLNINSGRLENIRTVYSNEKNQTFLSGAFAPNDSLLYVYNANGWIGQYQLYNDTTDIKSSEFIIKLDSIQGQIGALITASDKRTYFISPSKKQSLGAFETPDLVGFNSNFDLTKINLVSSINSKTFPTPMVKQTKEELDFIDSMAFICIGNSIAINSSSSFDSIIWNTKEKSPIISPSVTGLYSAKLYKDGCIYEDSIFVNVSPLVLVDSVEVCEGDRYEYKDVTYTAPNTIYDTLRGTGCDTLLEIRLLATEQIEQEQRLGICDGDEYRAPDGTIYRPGEVYTTTKPSSTSCDTLVKTLITALPLPNPMIEGQRILCFGTKTNLLVDKEYDHYDWNTSDSTRVVEVGRGSFEVKVIDSLGCEGSAQVTVIERPEWLLAVLEAVEIDGNYLFSIEGDVARINEWTVSPSEDLFLLAGDRLAAGGNTSPGLYRLEVKDEIGCISTVDFEIPEKVKSPATQQSNVFHPGSGNPENRVWKARMPENTTLDFAGIYDRWGNEIWSTQDPSIGWDGSMDGKEVGGGVYVFVIRYQLAAGGKEVQVGSVLLVK